MRTAWHDRPSPRFVTVTSSNLYSHVEAHDAREEAAGGTPARSFPVDVPLVSPWRTSYAEWSVFDGPPPAPRDGSDSRPLIMRQGVLVDQLRFANALTGHVKLAWALLLSQLLQQSAVKDRLSRQELESATSIVERASRFETTADWLAALPATVTESCRWPHPTKNFTSASECTEPSMRTLWRSYIPAPSNSPPYFPPARNAARPNAAVSQFPWRTHPRDPWRTAPRRFGVCPHTNSPGAPYAPGALQTLHARARPVRPDPRRVLVGG